jgi:hypothetical protein
MVSNIIKMELLRSIAVYFFALIGFSIVLIVKAFEDIPYIIDHAPPEFHYEINLGAFKQIVHVVVER